MSRKVEPDRRSCRGEPGTVDRVLDERGGMVREKELRVLGVARKLGHPRALLFRPAHGRSVAAASLKEFCRKSDHELR